MTREKIDAAAEAAIWYRELRETSNETFMPLYFDKHKILVLKGGGGSGKSYLRQSLISTFSVPEGARSELNTVIDRYADRMIKDGAVTETERRALFQALFEAGDMVVETNDQQAKALRDMVSKGRIYVDETVRAELGDNWNAMRRRALACGFYLVTDKSLDARGIDQWNMELSDAIPGLFKSDDTDLTEILYNIVEAAEEAQGEHMTLDQYAKELTGEYGRQAEDDFYDNIERQFDYALRSFAESAKIEMELRDRTGQLVARERENAAEARESERTRQAARRAREREWARQARAEANEQKILREMREKTLKQIQWLARNRDKAPADMRARFDEVLSDIDIYAISAAKE